MITAGELLEGARQSRGGGRMSATAHRTGRSGPARRGRRPAAAEPRRATRSAGGSASRAATSARCRSSSALIVIVIVFQIAEPTLPDRGQLRQPDHPGGGDHDHRHGARVRRCCWARSTCRSASSPASAGVLRRSADRPTAGACSPPRSRSWPRSPPASAIGFARRCSSRSSASRPSSSRWPACWPGTARAADHRRGRARSSSRTSFVIGFANKNMPSATAWILRCRRRRALRGRCCFWPARATRAPGCRPPRRGRCGCAIAGLAIARRWSSSTCATRTAASRTCCSSIGRPVRASGPTCSTARGSGATSTRSAATPRPRGAPASTSTTSRSPASSSAR